VVGEGLPYDSIDLIIIIIIIIMGGFNDQEKE